MLMHFIRIPMTCVTWRLSAVNFTAQVVNQVDVGEFVGRRHEVSLDPTLVLDGERRWGAESDSLRGLAFVEAPFTSGVRALSYEAAGRCQRRVAGQRGFILQHHALTCTAHNTLNISTRRRATRVHPQAPRPHLHCTQHPQH